MVDDSDEDVQAAKPSASAAAGKKKLVKVQVLICTQYGCHIALGYPVY